MKVGCPYCQNALDLAHLGGRCPHCRALFEVYYDHDEAVRASEIYNNGDNPADPPAQVRQFNDANGWVVFFRDEGRLAEIAEQLLGGSG